jgi:hypothetical protein
MELTLVARDLLLVSWEIDPDRIARALPAGVEPRVLEGGPGLVSLVAYRNDAVRLDGRRAPSFSQVNVRTYVGRDEEAAVFLLSMRVTVGGLGGVLFGAPYRPATMRVRPGLARARGLGLSVHYRVTDAAGDAPALGSRAAGSEAVAYYWAAGLRRVPSDHDPFDWREVELEDEARVDPVLALGFDAGPPDSVLYAERTGFRVTLPPEKVA